MNGRSHPSLPAAGCAGDHGECIVCSDACIPLRVIALDGADAVCEDAGGARLLIAIELVQPVEIGDLLLTHGGVAIAHAGDPA